MTTDEYGRFFKGPPFPVYDPRYPTVNKSKLCSQNFIDSHRCNRKYGENYTVQMHGVSFKPCKYFEWAAKVRCSSKRLETLNEQLEAGALEQQLTFVSDK